MQVKLTTVSENTAAGPYFLSEWGWGILVQVDETNILFDTGAGFAAVRNADKLGIDFHTINKIILSHAHVDHTGGLREVLGRTGKVEVIAHPAIWEAKYAVRENQRERYIGIPFIKEQLESLGARFRLTKDPVWITDSIVTSGEIPLMTGYEDIDHNLYAKENGNLRPDNVPDDLAMAIKTDLGLVIILGCAHRGIINTIRHFQEITGDEPVYCVVGGTHLISASPERLTQTVADLRETGIQRLGVSHCTGFHASARLAGEFADIFFLNNAGSQFTLL